MLYEVITNVFWVVDETYLIAALGTAVLTFVVVRRRHLPANLFLIPDAIGLALFVITSYSIHYTKLYDPMLKKNAIGANAWTVIKRTEFNAGKYAPNVGDDVRIDIAIEAIAQ